MQDFLLLFKNAVLDNHKNCHFTIIDELTVSIEPFSYICVCELMQGIAMKLHLNVIMDCIITSLF